LRELIRERAPWFDANPEQLCWGALAPFEHRLTQRFGQGRIWLAGDAAHSTSPIGFQSMNRGFSEADKLSSLIAGSLFQKGYRDERFEQFERDQQAEWVRLFGLWQSAMVPWDPTELAPCLPASGADFDALLEQLSASVPATARLCH
jgi:2-polyprenyl-6-methoxyphenol hydroxylase-like FAD-dependent oxidoreductase